MRYSRDRSRLFPLEDSRYKAVLDQRLGAGEAGEQGSILRQIVDRDRRLRYEMTARYVPLLTIEIIHLLKSFIEEQKDGESTISEAGEDAVQVITGALLKRAEELQQGTRYTEAAGIAFSVLVTIEPELCNVYDEGFTYQCIMDDAFDFLNRLSELEYGLETEVLLVCTAVHFLKGINEGDRYYEHRWKGVIAALGKSR